MKKVSINQLIDGLTKIPDADFVCDTVYSYLAENPVEFDSVKQYLHWSPAFYTRNLIYKDTRFEMLAICWESGQVSRIHNHSEQRCWMTVPLGRLKGQNFVVEEIDETRGHCKLRETDSFELNDRAVAKVELEEPVHQILNLSEFNERAVSIHIYSKPYDRCLSYCRDTDTFKEVKLYYTSIDGKLCDGVSLSESN
ncbi:MAG: cysteine dioxygenase [Pyrinomonadaceae bacterium]